MTDLPVPAPAPAEEEGAAGGDAEAETEVTSVLGKGVAEGGGAAEAVLLAAQSRRWMCGWT